MLVRAIVVGLVGISVAACGSDPPPSYVEPVPSTSRLHYGEEPIYTETVEQVVDTPEGLTQLWDRIRERAAAPSPQPTVNFDRRMVVVVGGGQRKAGDRVRVDSVAVRDEQFRIYYTIVLDCFEGAPTVYPLQIVEVGRSEYARRFFPANENKQGCTAPVAP